MNAKKLDAVKIKMVLLNAFETSSSRKNRFAMYLDKIILEEINYDLKKEGHPEDTTIVNYGLSPESLKVIIKYIDCEKRRISRTNERISDQEIETIVGEIAQKIEH